MPINLWSLFQKTKNNRVTNKDIIINDKIGIEIDGDDQSYYCDFELVATVLKDTDGNKYIKWTMDGKEVKP